MRGRRQESRRRKRLRRLKKFLPQHYFVLIVTLLGTQSLTPSHTYPRNKGTESPLANGTRSGWTRDGYTVNGVSLPRHFFYLWCTCGRRSFSHWGHVVKEKNFVNLRFRFLHVSGGGSEGYEGRLCVFLESGLCD